MSNDFPPLSPARREAVLAHIARLPDAHLRQLAFSVSGTQLPDNEPTSIMLLDVAAEHCDVIAARMVTAEFSPTALHLRDGYLKLGRELRERCLALDDQVDLAAAGVPT